MSTTNTLGVTLAASLGWLQNATLTDGTIVTDPGNKTNFSYSKSTTTGTTVDLADVIWHDQRTLTASSNDDIDLSALTRSIYGSSVASAFVRVKGIYICNTNTVTGDYLRIDSSVTNGFVGWCVNATSKCEIGPDSVCILASKKDGWTVDGTHKVLRITANSSHTVIYNIAIFGTSA